MLNLEIIDTVYIAPGATDLRNNIEGLSLLVESKLSLSPYEKALFVFCNKSMNRLKILHFDEGFWIYYFRLESGRFKWPKNAAEALKVDKNELKWILKGYEVRYKTKFKKVTSTKYY